MNLKLLFIAIQFSIFTLAASSKIRLVGGRNSNEGRVEVLHRSYSWFAFFSSEEWGTVCDDSWSTNDARVVCRQLGLPDSNAEAVGNAVFGEGSGEIWLDDVGCSGLESSLDECRHNGWGSHDCDHSEDAGVRCPDSGRIKDYISYPKISIFCALS